MRKANCAKAMKTMPNMMKKASTSGALRCSVPASCDMVLLKEMYLKILMTPRNTVIAASFWNVCDVTARYVKSANFSGSARSAWISVGSIQIPKDLPFHLFGYFNEV